MSHLPRWMPTQQTVRQLLAPSLVFIVACLDRQFQTDFWMHLARGAEIVATGRLITADHFTIAGPAARVLDANWLSQIFYFRLFSWGGLSLVQVFNALTLAAALWFLVRVCYRAGTSWRSAAVGGVITFLVAWQTFLIRPQSFSVLLFVLLYGILRGSLRAANLRATPSLRYSEGSDQTLKSEPSEYLRLGVVSAPQALAQVPTPSRPFALLICAPLILLLWANVHGGFVIGLVLIGVFALASAIEWIGHRTDAAAARSLLASLLLSILATLFNPYGWRIYQYAFSLTARVMPRHIEEWMPPPMNQWIGIALVASVLLLVGLYFVKRRRPTISDALLMLCFLPLAFHSARMVIWWAIVVAPMIASLPGSTEPESEQRSSPLSFWMSGTLCAVLVIVCVFSLPWLERINPIFSTVRSPHRTESDLDAIAEAGLAQTREGTGIIFARMEWGQYLDWRLGPRHRLFIDGHVELVSDRAWHDYCQVTSGDPLWQEVLDRYHVDFLLLDTTYQSSLQDRVEQSGKWEKTFRSGDAILFVRREVKPPSHDAALTCPIKTPMGPGISVGDGLRGAVAQSGSSGGSRQFYGR